MEAIVRLAPDLVIAYSRNPGPELEKKGEALGSGYSAWISTGSKVLEKEVRALRASPGKGDGSRQVLAGGTGSTWTPSVQARRSGGPSFRLRGELQRHITQPGRARGHEMCLVSGGRCVAGDLSIPYAVVTSEWVISRNPDVIVRRPPSATVMPSTMPGRSSQAKLPS
jgi:iron complex transport system substrate-binding protein